MKSLTLKGIPDELLEQLRKRAEQNHRSLNGELLHLLGRSVSTQPVTPMARLNRIHLLQTRIPLSPLTDEILDEAIGEGRP
jgi:plasmid stability protein